MCVFEDDTVQMCIVVQEYTHISRNQSRQSPPLALMSLWKASERDASWQQIGKVSPTCHHKQ